MLREYKNIRHFDILHRMKSFELFPSEENVPGPSANNAEEAVVPSDTMKKKSKRSLGVPLAALLGLSAVSSGEADQGKTPNLENRVPIVEKAPVKKDDDKIFRYSGTLGSNVSTNGSGNAVFQYGGASKNSSTNAEGKEIYTYGKQKTWTPQTLEQKESARKAKENLKNKTGKDKWGGV